MMGSCQVKLDGGTEAQVWAAMASSNCLRETEGKESNSGGVRFSQPLTGLVVVVPSHPMCVTCFTSVGNPITISISLSSLYTTLVCQKNK